MINIIKVKLLVFNVKFASNLKLLNANKLNPKNNKQQVDKM